MRLLFASSVVSCAVFLGTATLAWSQTSITGSDLVFKSSGTQSTTLNQTGYIGTYLTVPAGGATVNFGVNATGTASPGHMNVVIADSQFGFNVVSTSATDYTTPNVTLPAGTYFVRVERDYGNGVNHSFSVNNLSVGTTSGAAATFSNINPNGATAGAAAANAMSAANTYINNFRKGNLNLSVFGAAPGMPIEIKEVNSAFKWGTAVPDSLSTYLATGSKYSQLLKKDFNSVTPENAGKWGFSDTASQLQNLDILLKFASQNNFRVRGHNLIWGTRNPTRVDADFTDARSTIPATAAAGKAAIQSEVTTRINNYLGGNITGTSTPRASQYAELDVYNESYHTGANTSISTGDNYWKVLGDGTTAGGAAPVADIYNRVQTAVTNAGAGTKLFTNEYSVLDKNTDLYGQFYSQHVESIRKAGGAVTGIGTEYYTDPGVGQGSSQVDPSRAYATWQNLSAQGLPLEVTEFGETAGADADQAASLTAAMTLAFGTQQINGFTLWGFYATPGLVAASLGSVLYDTNYNITAAGQAYEALRSSWNSDFTSTVNADGSVTLPDTAFYGDYSVIIGGKSYPLSLVKGTSSYSLTLPTGDYNGDGKVDAADYTVWRDSIGSTTDLRADGDGNGAIGAGDYDAWVAMFGNVYSSGAGAGTAVAVPEPTGAVLLLAGIALMLLRRAVY
jgi:GH35 family endo-1,4-beta-xylanase